MKVIFLENLKGVGKKSEVKEMKDGYVRNFLLPRKLAEIATPERLEKLAKERSLAEANRKELVKKLEEKARRISETNLVFKLKLGKKGEVFGSVTGKDIEEALKEKGFSNLKAELERPLKAVAEEKVKLDLGEGVLGVVGVVIEGEE